MNVNRNTVSILEALVSGDGSASVEELCHALGLSRQLLLYYLGTLNDNLQIAGYPRIGLEGDWLSLDGSSTAALATLVDASDRADYAFVKEERHDLMVLMMALRPSPVTISSLCSFFLVSRSTITSDIASLRTSLEREGLRVASFGRDGYRIEGEERSLRWRTMESFYRLDSAVARRVCSFRRCETVTLARGRPRGSPSASRAVFAHPSGQSRSRLAGGCPTACSESSSTTCCAWC